MNGQPIVSVIICFFEAQRFLRQALQSVFAQSFKDWELILVDDGSRDGGPEIAREVLARRPDRIRILEHPERENRGISASRNLGLREARGRYVAFLDADDVWLPEKLERQVALLEAHRDVAMTYGPTQQWHGWTGRPRDALRDVWMPTYVPSGSIVGPPDLLTLYLRTRGAAVPGMCSLLVRREAVNAVGGFDDTFRGVFEDQVFFSRICLDYPVLVTDDQTTRYRQHDTSCCASAVRSGEYDPLLPNTGRARYLVWLRELLTERQTADPALMRALRCELRPYRYSFLRWRWTIVPRTKLAAKRGVKRLIRRIFPAPIPRWIKARVRRRLYVPPTGWVRFGHLRRTEPLSRTFGYDRGMPVDRHYIERFLTVHAADLRGRSLEAGDDTYTRRFGGERVDCRDVLHPDEGTPGASIIADLASADHLPSSTFDCIVLTQTLQLIFDLPAAVRTLHRILKPGGVLLVTMPGLSQLDEENEWSRSRYWSFTAFSARRLFASVFPADAVEVAAYGNVLAATAFLHGMAAQELRPEELDRNDPSYPLLITVRAVKEHPQAAQGADGAAA